MDTTAQEIMSRELITIRNTGNVEEALKLLVNHRITGVPVVDARGRMVGILSEYDLIQQLSRHRQLSPRAFAERIRFSRRPAGVKTTTPLKTVVKKFVDSKYRRIPVLDDRKRLVGIITRRDLMRIFYYQGKLP